MDRLEINRLFEEQLSAVTGGMSPGDLPGEIIEEGDAMEQCPDCLQYMQCHYVWKSGYFGRSKQITGYCESCKHSINYTLVYKN